MIAAIVHKTPGIILDKLNRLLNALQDVKNNYERTAKNIQNKQLQLSLLGLAQESKQYANELISHIETLGGRLHEKYKSDFNKVEEESVPLTVTDSREEIKQLNIGEQLVLKTYRDVLNEPFLYDTIRQMVRYQQNGLLHCFSQIRMLYATMLKTAT